MVLAADVNQKKDFLRNKRESKIQAQEFKLDRSNE